MSDERWKNDIEVIKNKSIKVIREVFNESNLSENVYTVVYEDYDTVMGLFIKNNSLTNSLIVKVNDMDIPIQPNESFNGDFLVFTSLTIIGIDLTFDACIEG